MNELDRIRKILERLREVENRASGGPWCWGATGDKSNDWSVGVAVNEKGDYAAGQIEDGDGYDPSEEVCNGEDRFGNAECIVASRNALLPLVEALERVLNRTEQQQAFRIRRIPDQTAAVLAENIDRSIFSALAPLIREEK